MSNNVKEENVLPEKWERSSGVFTSDDMIDAYHTGKKMGVAQHDAIYREKFNSNFQQATSLAEKLFSFLTEKQFNPFVAKLRAKTIDIFDIVVIVDENAYFRDEFDSAYELAHQLRENSISQTFSINFYLIPKSESLDTSLMASDGFTWNYDPKRTSPSKREA